MKLRVVLCLLMAWPLAGAVSFHKEVRPILARKCQACHQGTNRSGGVALVTHADLKAVGGKLLDQIRGEKPRMPKFGQPLTPSELALIEKWVEEGWKDDSPAGSNELWWSLRPLKKPAVPGGAGSPVDAFVRAKLAANGLTPSPEADRRTLIRRVMLDLHGLPPTPEQVAAFVADPAPDAYERLVDRLLASPRYGERWARHWLDVVHYGETHGYDKDKPRVNAWPYRDWVIAALNQDKPYKRFVQEQIAGDVLFPNDPQALVATGFLAAGPWDFVGHQELREGTTDKNITRVLDRDDMVAATVSSFASMTAHCARCHNHKFDPIPQEDYYKLQAVFAGVDRADRAYDADPAVHAARQKLVVKKRAIYVELQPLLDKVEFATSKEIEELDDRILDAKLQLAHIGTAKTEAEAAKRQQFQDSVTRDTKRRKELVDAIVGEATYAGIARLQAEAKALDVEIAKLPKPEQVYAASNFFPIAGKFRPAMEPRPVHLLERGSVGSPGKEVTPGALRVMEGVSFELQGEGEGARRAALARWITDDKNPLPWRSIVNRVWHHHFGMGIVDTPNDFGRMGSEPVNPELLDWLAVWFRDEAGGSMKALHRLLVTSATYRQSSKPRPEGEKADAENRMLWRMNPLRLDAETVRDSVLQVAGKLDLKMGGPSVRMFWFKDDHSPIYDYSKFDVDAEGSYRRSVYRFVVRSVPDPFLERLDCPDPSLLTPKRNTTLTAIQALALLNNPFMVRMAEHLAARAEGPLAAQVAYVTRAVLTRESSAEEATAFAAYAEKHGLASLCRLLFNTNEFLFAD